MVIGERYELGAGLPEDKVEAYKWFTLAASHPIPTEFELRDTHEAARDMARNLRDAAGKNLDHLAGRMSAEQLAEAKRRVSEWRTK